jgi:hypothetical protein
MKKRFSIVILKKRWAFSLIELSIVILIIGIVVAGITQGSRLVREMRIQAAASLTKSSGINGIKGLSMWLETTSSSSITSSTRGLNPDDNDKVAGWNDINSQKNGKINVTQTSDSLRPTYIVDGIGDLPSIKFDGADYLSSLASAGGSVPLDANSDNFTYVAVWLSNTNSGTQVIFEQNTTTSQAGKRAAILIANNTYGFSGQANDAFGASYGTSSSPHISVMTVGQANGVNDDVLTVKVYTNSNNASYTDPLDAGSTTKQNVGVDAFYIGAKATNNGEKLNGMISEIIIFDRVLMKEELSEVVNYLSKKYRIKLS